MYLAILVLIPFSSGRNPILQPAGEPALTRLSLNPFFFRSESHHFHGIGMVP